MPVCQGKRYAFLGVLEVHTQFLRALVEAVPRPLEALAGTMPAEGARQGSRDLEGTERDGQVASRGAGRVRPLAMRTVGESHCPDGT